MTLDNFSNSVGGALRLKGASGPVGISKQKKKKKKQQKKSQEASVEASATSKPESSVEVTSTIDNDHQKTPSELAHEEVRRKRLHDRLTKDGLKTHKQRVEELNKYLSNLSEHHDMPRIGPG
ncbi:unnamed protein product [Blumeria hordei]|uniref:DUF1754-domain-containing protein n=2 Tax=Blumeria hordei TaxID=2867405 RepID=A0A383UY97_BLUHO|nr:DUF1754 superfamily protein [Blumeria hordei DH14]SZF04555.1 unnamed protein product [Blumeria hordei]